jgi:hypothetical protein
MPTKKKSKTLKPRRAVEIIVPVPHGTRRMKTDQLIQDALRQVETEVFEREEVVVVQVVHDGNGNGLITKKITQ